MPHTCHSQYPSGVAQLGGFRTFGGSRSGDKLAPSPAVRGTLIEPRKRPKGSLDDLVGAGEEPIAIHSAEREAGLRVDSDTRDSTLPST